MPQMSPFNWLLLNLYFTMIMILLMIIIYYFMPPLNKKSLYSTPEYLYKFKW